MSSQLGEIYRCPDERCGFEVLVVHETRLPSGETQNPTCCCGQKMTPVKS